MAEEKPTEAPKEAVNYTDWSNEFVEKVYEGSDKKAYEVKKGLYGETYVQDVLKLMHDPDKFRDEKKFDKESLQVFIDDLKSP